MKRKTTLLVMAAGMGSRFGSLKQITPLGPHQKALLHYTIYDAVHAGFDKIVFVIRESFAKEFIDFVGKYAEGLVETAYCYQSMDKLPGGMPPPPVRCSQGMNLPHPLGSLHGMVLPLYGYSPWLRCLRIQGVRLRGLSVKPSGAP